MLAEQALRMHDGRVHAGIIRSAGQRNGNGAGKKAHRSHLTEVEVEAILAFIRDNRLKFSTKSACFAAALEAAGAAGKILPNSTAVNRYFAKAVAVEAMPVTLKRKYTRRAPAPAEQHIHVNFCPNCGCNMQAVATGIAMAGHIK